MASKRSKRRDLLALSFYNKNNSYKGKPVLESNHVGTTDGRKYLIIIHGTDQLHGILCETSSQNKH